MQAGEILRRTAFQMLDKLHGRKLEKIKTVNKREIVEGVTQEYGKRRVEMLLDYAKKHSPYYKVYHNACSLQDFPVMTKMKYNEN